jgi:hypothetical protein
MIRDHRVMVTRSSASRALVAPFLALAFALLSVAACGSKGGAKSPEGTEPTASTTASTPPPPPACADAPANPGEVLAKEPTVFNACLAGAKPDPKLCGSAKIAVTIGKDGRVSNAQVAQSTLPDGVTDCIKARLAAMQFACPKEGSASYTIPVGFPGTGGCPGLPGAPAAP